LVSERSWCVFRRGHAGAVVPVGCESYIRGTNEVIGRTGDEKTLVRAGVQSLQGKLVGTWVRFVETGALGGDEDREIDSDAINRDTGEALRAIGNDSQGNTCGGE